MSGLLSRLFKNSSLLAIMNAASLGGLFLFSVLLGRELGSATLGLYTVLSASLMPFIYFADFGQSSSLVQNIGKQPQKIRQTIRDSILLKLLLSLLSIFILFLFSFFIFEEKTERRFFWSFGFLVAPRVIYQTLETALRAVEQMLYPMLSATFSAATLVGGTWLLLTNNNTFQAIIFLFIGVETLRTIFTYFCYRKTPAYQISAQPVKIISWDRHKKLLKEAFPFFSIGIIGVLIYRVDVILLGKLGTNEQVGEFAAASNFVKLLRVVPSVIVAAFFPMISGMSDSIAKLRQVTAKTISLQLLANFISASVIFMLASWLLEISYRLPSATEILKTYVWSVVPLGVYSTVIYLFFKLEKSGWTLKILCAALIFNIGMNYWLIPKFGAKALAMSGLASETFCCLAFGASMIFLFRKHSEEPHE